MANNDGREATKTESIFAPCVLCSRERMRDLLDEKGICDYCRELQVIQGGLPLSSGRNFSRKELKELGLKTIRNR